MEPIININELFAIANDITNLDIYLYYDCFIINYTVNNLKYKSIIEYNNLEECDEIDIVIGNDLHKMIHIESFSYTSRFYSETDHYFLKTKPKKLIKLSLDNLQGLDLNFLDGLTHLTLTDFDHTILDKLVLLPKSIKYIDFINDSVIVQLS